MTKLLDLIGNTLQKHGLFPAVAILALVLGGKVYRWNVSAGQTTIPEPTIYTL